MMICDEAIASESSAAVSALTSVSVSDNFIFSIRSGVPRTTKARMVVCFSCSVISFSKMVRCGSGPESITRMSSSFLKVSILFRRDNGPMKNEFFGSNESCHNSPLNRSSVPRSGIHTSLNGRINRPFARSTIGCPHRRSLERRILN